MDTTTFRGIFITTHYYCCTKNSFDFYKFFSRPEGYVEFKNNQYLYTYQYKNHLGNIRLTYRDGYRNHPTLEYAKDGVIQVTEIIEENNYYPFGLKHKGYNELADYSATNKYKYAYGGKELNDELGLDWYDFHARQYDPSIGRMLQMDPNAYKYGKLTPYNYAFNNPALVVDPDGKDGIVTGSGTKDDPYRIKANYYYYGLDSDQKSGFLSAIDSYNNNGKAHQIKDNDGNKIYTIFELNPFEASSEDAAFELANNDIVTVVDGDNVANLSFGNTVTSGAAGDSMHLGKAGKNSIFIDGDATKSFFNSPNPNTKISSIYKGVSIHEIGHNLGGNHNDPGNIMIHPGKNYNTGKGINEKEGTIFSSPSVNNNGIQAILGRMINVDKVLRDSRAGYGTTSSSYFGSKQNKNITSGSVGRLVYKPD